jgi:hypothetical protein
MIAVESGRSFIYASAIARGGRGVAIDRPLSLAIVRVLKK